MMQLKQRSFKGNSFRPLPEVFINEDFNLFCVVTPWGPANEIQKILDFLLENYESLSGDEEKTKQHLFIESLSQEENILRTLLLSLNNWVFTKQNLAKEYKFAYEIFLGVFKDRVLTYCQIGQPFACLDREDFDLQFLGSVLDFSALFAKKGKRLAPLPSFLMGLKPDAHFPVFSLPFQKQDRLLLLCRDFVPASFLQQPRKDRQLEDLVSLLSVEDPQTPFWLGQLLT